MARVVDASAIGAVLFGEQDGPWGHAMVSGPLLLVPGIFHFELGNACWTKLRRHPGEADALLSAWLDWNAEPPVTAVPVDPMITMQLARETNLTFYDASYLWLARDRAADLISLDARLVRAARRLGLHAPLPDNGPAHHTTPRSRN